jgi:RimJ/RimL family protein N-acetyltransferase
MTNTQPFDYASHGKFIEKLKEDKTKLYLAWFFNNEFVASFNLVDIIAQKSADRGLFVNPLFQAKSIAKFIEKQVEYIARNNYSIDTLTAEVLKNNNKSFRYHISNGYKIIMEDQKYYYFSKQI